MDVHRLHQCHKKSFGKELKVEVPRIPSTKLLAKSYDSHLKLFPQFAVEYRYYIWGKTLIEIAVEYQKQLLFKAVTH